MAGRLPGDVSLCVRERERGFGHSKLSAGKVKGLNEAADRPLTCWENELLGG